MMGKIETQQAGSLADVMTLHQQTFRLIFMKALQQVGLSYILFRQLAQEYAVAVFQYQAQIT